jgi:hypothetical protein
MSETPQERAEAARVRRRWINLGELVAVLALVISALTLWNSYRERTNAEAEHASESAATAKKATVLVLKAVPDKDGKLLTLAPRSEEQAIQSQTIRFPAPLGITPADTSGDSRIERGWFQSALVNARKKAGIEERPGDARLPVLIETHYLADGDAQVDRAVYELGYATSHGLLGGTEIRLRGLSRLGKASSARAGQQQIDALWQRRMAAKRS